MKKITHLDIANYVEKNKTTVDGWTQRQPRLLELVKLGMWCKKNNLDTEKITKLMEFHEMIKGDIK